MANLFYIFKIKREERWGAMAALLYVLLWNVLLIVSLPPQAFALSDNYGKLFGRYFHVSGFDPVSYTVISHWGAEYNIYRHPLLAFFMYIPNRVNQVLIDLTGINLATVIMGLILVFCGFYSFILLYRIFREVIGLRRTDAWLLGWLTFSFAYVMVGISVPDHFSLSMFMLILTLYVAGRKMKAGHAFTKWQTVVFFFITAGISLNNGIKVFLANLFVNGKKFFKPANLILAVILPSLVIWGVARTEYKELKWPEYKARVEKNQAAAEKRHAKIAQTFRDTTSLRDTAAINRGIEAAIASNDSARNARKMMRAVYKHTGKPIDHTEFGQWTDITTPRLSSLVENIFGEPIQLHQDYLLKDVLVNRPVIVEYRYVFNYIIEAVIALLFLAGVWCGYTRPRGRCGRTGQEAWQRRFLSLALSFFGFDLVIHFVLGFGLNEVYIMSPHWLFIITIAMAYFVRRMEASRWLLPLRVSLALLTVYLIAWNGTLYVSYLFF